MRKVLITEVKLRINKAGFVQIMNTILTNAGDFKQLDISDNWEMIVETVEYINKCYSFNMLYLVDWEACKSFRYFSKKQMNNRINFVSKITKIICDTDNCYNMELIVDYSDYNYWEKVIPQYTNSSWVIDNIIYNEEYEEYQNGGRTPLNSVIMTNMNGHTSIQGIDPNDIPNIREVRPIHLGYVYLLKLYSDIILFQEDLYQKGSSEIYKSMFDTAQDIINKEYNVWINSKNTEAQEKDTIDYFSIFHIPANERIVKSWQYFNGDYCPISKCFAAQFKPLTHKRKVDNEIVVQPLWL